MARDSTTAAWVDTNIQLSKIYYVNLMQIIILMLKNINLLVCGFSVTLHFAIFVICSAKWQRGVCVFEAAPRRNKRMRVEKNSECVFSQSALSLSRKSFYDRVSC